MSSKLIKLRSDFFYKRISIIAPDLLIYEVINALSYNPKFNSGHVVEALNSLNSMQLKIIKPVPQVMEIAVNIRYKKNISISRFGLYGAFQVYQCPVYHCGQKAL